MVKSINTVPNKILDWVIEQINNGHTVLLKTMAE